MEDAPPAAGREGREGRGTYDGGNPSAKCRTGVVGREQSEVTDATSTTNEGAVAWIS